MNFLILGCSWGVPNYYGPPGDPAEGHIEYLLRDAGHTVYNCAKNAGSNLFSISRAKCYLGGAEITHPASNHKICLEESNIKIDWIIWFQTEFLRDASSVPSSQHIIEDLARLTYSTCNDFVNSLGAKLALIGANSDLHPCYQEYLTPEFVVPSWTSDILNIDPVRFDIKDPELEFKFIDNELRLQKLKRTSQHFPDTSHPGTIAHANLTQRLLKCVTNLNSPRQ